MEMKLYNTVDGDNVINKELNLIHTLQIKLKDNVSITNPIIILSKIAGVDFFQCNYAYLSEFNRYYFIREIEVLNNNNYRFILECDVLETFKDDILNSKAEIRRNIKEGDFISVVGATDLRKEIDIYNSDLSFVEGYSIVLSVIGG